MQYPIRDKKKFAVVQRRAVTRRASRIFEPSPATRKQDAVMSGQTCVAQLIVPIWRRSPLARAAVPLASTVGDRQVDNGGSEEHDDRQSGEGFEHLGVQTLVALNPTAFGGFPSITTRSRNGSSGATFVCMACRDSLGFIEIHADPPSARTRRRTDGATIARSADVRFGSW
jgi:hypothetical protein